MSTSLTRLSLALSALLPFSTATASGEAAAMPPGEVAMRTPVAIENASDIDELSAAKCRLKSDRAIHRPAFGPGNGKGAPLASHRESPRTACIREPRKAARKALDGEQKRGSPSGDR